MPVNMSGVKGSCSVSRISSSETGLAKSPKPVTNPCPFCVSTIVNFSRLWFGSKTIVANAPDRLCVSTAPEMSISVIIFPLTIRNVSSSKRRRALSRAPAVPRISGRSTV